MSRLMSRISPSPKFAPGFALVPVLGSALRLALGLAAIGCRYDVDKLYAHEEAEATEDVPEQLIELSLDKPFSTVDDECAACAEQKCAKVNTSCREDPECVALTRCVA